MGFYEIIIMTSVHMIDCRNYKEASYRDKKDILQPSRRKKAENY